MGASSLRESCTISSWRAPKPITRTLRSSRSRRNVVDRTSVSRSWAWPTLPECIAQAEDDVNTLALVGETLYVGGDFASIGRQ